MYSNNLTISSIMTVTMTTVWTMWSFSQCYFNVPLETHASFCVLLVNIYKAEYALYPALCACLLLFFMVHNTLKHIEVTAVYCCSMCTIPKQQQQQKCCTTVSLKTVLYSIWFCTSCTIAAVEEESVMHSKLLSVFNDWHWCTMFPSVSFRFQF